MAKDKPHLFLKDVHSEKNYTSTVSGGDRDQKKPERDRQSHSQRLKSRWQAIWDETRKHDASRKAVAMPTREGAYIEFEGLAGYELVTQSLEKQGSGIKLLNVAHVPSADQQVTRATIFVPSNKQHLLLTKLEQYANEETDKGTPRHQKLIESIEHIRIAVLESMWRDDKSLMPTDTVPTNMLTPSIHLHKYVDTLEA